MIVNIDRSLREASRVSMLGNAALGDGDTTKAAELFRDAGKRLAARADAERAMEKRDELRYLAATQYYKGGDYKRAAKICGRIDRSALDIPSRPGYDVFVREVRTRAAAEYRYDVRRRLLEVVHDQPAQLLVILQHHPYVLPPATMAFLRAISCVDLHDYRAAVLFFSDTLRFGGDRYRPAFYAAGSIMSLEAHDRRSVGEYADQLLITMPSPIVVLTISAMHYRLAMACQDPSDREVHLSTQIRLFERVENDIHAMRIDDFIDDERYLVSIGLQTAALTLARDIVTDRSIEIAELARAWSMAGHATDVLVLLREARANQTPAPLDAVVREFSSLTLSFKQRSASEVDRELRAAA